MHAETILRSGGIDKLETNPGQVEDVALLGERRTLAGPPPPLCPPSVTSVARVLVGESVNFPR
jgi:hypothetical protein